MLFILLFLIIFDVSTALFQFISRQLITKLIVLSLSFILFVDYWLAETEVVKVFVTFIDIYSYRVFTEQVVWFDGPAILFYLLGLHLNIIEVSIFNITLLFLTAFIDVIE